MKYLNIKYLVFALVAMLFFAACSSNFDKVKIGMPTAELQSLVGSPDSIRDDFFSQLWFYPDYAITICDDSVSAIRTKEQMRIEVQQMMEEYRKIKNKE